MQEIINRSLAIRERYHQIEERHHGNKWSVEEDALAFLTDAALIGRYTMSQQVRWPKGNTPAELEHKLGESIWWLIVLANRMDLNIEDAVNKFLTRTEDVLD
ncbi:nucleoside triphosphate pyrophosphohydrolase family protein [Chitinophaga silvisoli]|uniref:MazG-like protein n=1 Tax=Chitinophaga silvisoli TaxID=2291814 RepID=A0A3E1P4T0_9BACT|nr:MazG-like protein [Chitinophaga silvisoli]RFM35177.1 MazG-like protein [Chitinophaga silvisoli]